ncbi:AbrB/MazE/SpoVT family DNA-binding domain-containing protein [Streptacidiphilus jiangxiensis]|uniref:Bifunctional DNA-binding transcriptional regulator of stationary/sporulation/toxin gene expression and antitoxin component of the YhaV-PrlF toxin-antitoxin module n=1 Tax=Streptacidiphilus jiangxiensis TaxID=235985 RepID=A0A1H7WJL2_STRJI|nr:AbrB/MazE/SpoVT family DNA-binding domain-containing protein [Streptacidiphilus jiangxiensis]SEM21544.1 Bifunctional DNA-binding transcriptional regulator of stationary/sporulation/toxin gene expression and antitoxin component of the YhaV-PrlF toxin-antitoxin module [Streptacidiphilus jiangxiensis]
MTTLTTPESLTPASRTKIGPRGRVTIPVALQRAAGLSEGDDVVIRVIAPGVFTLESVQAVLDRIRAAMPAAPEGTTWDATAEIRAERDAEDGSSSLLFGRDADEGGLLAAATTADRGPNADSPASGPPDPGPDLLRRLL